MLAALPNPGLRRIPTVWEVEVRYRERLQQIHEELDELEARLDAAEPASLSREFWNRILEKVESLPSADEKAWKESHMAKLRKAVFGG